MGAAFAGSSGTLIGAALETTGIFYQSYLLDALTDPFKHSLGALFYSCGIVAAIISFAITGKYRFAVWLLLGPGLFFSVVLPRTETSGAEWRFGTIQRDQEAVSREAANALAGAPKTVRVSSLFAAYNRLISSAVQEFIRVVNAGRVNSDKKFIYRGELLASLRSQQILDPDFREFLHHGFLRDCGKIVEAGQRAVEAPGPKERNESRAIVHANRFRPSRIPLSPPARRYLAKLIVDHPEVETMTKNQTGLAEGIQENNFRAGEQRRLARYQTEAGRKQLAEDISKKEAELQTQVFSCAEIWNYTAYGLYAYAMRMIETMKDDTAKRGLHWGELMADVVNLTGGRNRPEYVVCMEIARKKAGNPDDPEIRACWDDYGARRVSQLARIVAGTLLRNEIHGGSRTSAFLSDYAKRGREFGVLEAGSENDQAFLERSRAEAEEWQTKTRLAFSAASLPYYQGLALYFLALAFPLFALLLLIPGKHPGFMLWFVLWLWVKSWDIGYTVVMLLDDVLFALMAEGARLHGGPQEAMLSPDLDFLQTYYSLQKLDPSFRLSTYYSILAVAIHSIPLVTSYIILGSLKGGAGLIAAGMNRSSQWFSAGAGAMQGMEYVGALRSSAYEMQLERARGYLQNEKTLSNSEAAAQSTGAEQGQSLAREHGYQVSSRLRNNERTGMLGGWSADDVSYGAGWMKLFQGVAGGLADQRDFLGWGSKQVETLGETIGKRTGQPGKLPAAGWGGKARAATQVAGKIGEVLEGPLKQTGDSLMSLRDSNLKKSAVWARYDATNSTEVQRLAALSRIYGMLELPWTERGAWDKELESEIQWWTEMGNITGSVLKAAGKACTAGFGKKTGGKEKD